MLGWGGGGNGGERGGGGGGGGGGGVGATGGGLVIGIGGVLWKRPGQLRQKSRIKGLGHKQVGSQVGPGRLGAKFLAVRTEGKAEALAVLVWCRVGLGTGAHRVTLMEGVSHGFNALPAAGLFCLCHLNYLETRQ